MKAFDRLLIFLHRSRGTIEEASGTEQIADCRFQKGEILRSFLLLVSDFCSACHGNATQSGKGSFGGSDS
jgi:hypothetical protein